MICLSLTLLHLTFFRDCEWKLCTHNTLSFSLSLAPFPIQESHMYTKIMCVKNTLVFFGEGDLFCPKRWTTLLTTYSNEHKICQVEASKVQNAREACPQQSIPNRDRMAQLFPYSKSSHTPKSAVVHTQERTSVRAVIPHHFAGVGGC